MLSSYNKSIGNKITLFAVFIVLLTVSAFSYVFVSSINKDHVTESKKYLSRTAQTATGLQAVYSSFSFDTQSYFKSVVEITRGESDFYIFDQQFKLVFSENLFSKDKLQASYGLGEVFPTLGLDSIKDKEYYFFTYRGRDVLAYSVKSGRYHLVFVKDMEDSYWELISLPAVSVFLVVIVLLLMFSWLLAKQTATHLQELIDVSNRFVTGERTINIDIVRNDEVGMLSVILQGLMRQIRERERNLKKSERRIRETRDYLEKTIMSKETLLDDVRRQKQEIENINREQDELLAIVSHDLKNPLGVIETSMDILNEENHGDLSQMSQDLIKRSKNSARTAQALITDLLDLARLDGEIKLDKEKIYLNEMIHNIVDSYILQAQKKNINLELVAKENYDIVADYGRFHQVIANIVGNAVKFTPVDGEVLLDIFLNEQNEILITVTDNGPGIPEDKIDTIFNKYEQAREGDRKIGTGLGLAICKKICLLHDGDISVTSKEGEGAKFTIALPQGFSHNVGSDADGAKEKSIVNHIIIADESKEYCKGIARHIANDHLECHLAKDGEELLFLVGKYPSCFVVTNVRLPVTDGITAVKRINAKFPDVDIIMLSEDEGKQSLDFLKTMKVVDVFTRDANQERIALSIRKRLLSDVKPVAKAAKVAKDDNTEAIVTSSATTEMTTKKLLLVDDSDDMHALVKVLCKKISIVELSHAYSGENALEVLDKESFDLILIDMNMTGITGIETVETYLKNPDHRQDTKFVLLTADNFSGREKELEDKGFYTYMGKPVSKGKLHKLLGELYGFTP